MLGGTFRSTGKKSQHVAHSKSCIQQAKRFQIMLTTMRMIICFKLLEKSNPKMTTVHEYLQYKLLIFS